MVGGCAEKPAPRAGLTDKTRVEPPVVFEGPLRVADRLVQRINRAASLLVPEALNPLAQTGAIANTTLIVAVVSGVVLLVWYSSSVHLAHQSMATMGALGGFVRAMHRYSSDACMLFVLVHALQIAFQRRFGGARWLAWVTGAMLVSTLWLVGWLGYWLTWDERAKQVALGTARVLDPLPIFTDPLARSFLTDETVGSLLFFIVFFFHMLIPLAMGIALWLHITRLSRPHFLTSKRMTPWVVGTLALLSVVRPADLAAPAHMQAIPSGFSIDAWYLAPMWLTDRLGAGLLWTLLLAGGIAMYSIPWALARRRAEPARVIESKCNACERCVKDCPYDAIHMVPRENPERFPIVASVDPSKCIGCGICAGSCDSAGIGLPWFDVVKKRAEMDRDLELAPRPVAFVCAESAKADLPGWRITEVPCAGWVHALTVERAIRHGAERVLVVSCASSCMYREGPKWTRARMSGAREPMLDRTKVDPKKVRVLELFPHEGKRLAEEAARFAPSPSRRSSALGIALALGIGALVWVGSRVTYALPAGDKPELVISFKHPGMVGEACRDLTEAEKQKTPPHMRPPKICERKRVPVRMRVFVDDAIAVDRSYAPSGLWSDGNSLALERIPIDAGEHRVRIEIGDTPDASAWPYTSEQTFLFTPRTAHVARFDKVGGFSWK